MFEESQERQTSEHKITFDCEICDCPRLNALFAPERKLPHVAGNILSSEKSSLPSSDFLKSYKVTFDDFGRDCTTMRACPSWGL
jgi:hypothetical protein